MYLPLWYSEMDERFREGIHEVVVSGMHDSHCLFHCSILLTVLFDKPMYCMYIIHPAGQIRFLLCYCMSITC